MDSVESSRDHGDSLGTMYLVKPRSNGHVQSQVCKLPPSPPTSILIFWPRCIAMINSEGPPSFRAGQTCLILGWRVDGAPSEVSLVVVGLASEQHLASPSSASPNRKPLQVLGLCRLVQQGKRPPSNLGSPRLSRSSSARVWMEVDLLESRWSDPQGPKAMRRAAGQDLLIRRITLAGTEHFSQSAQSSLSTNTFVSLSIVHYRAPNTRMLQYFALEPLQLGPVSGLGLAKLGSLLMRDETIPRYFQERDAHYPTSGAQDRLRSLVLVDPARWAELGNQDLADPYTKTLGSALRASISLLNQVPDALQDGQCSESDRCGKMSDGSRSYRRIVEAPFHLVTRILRQIQSLLSFEVPFGDHTHGDLRSLSASLKQLDVRLTQLLLVPPLAARLRFLRKSGKLSTAQVSAPYIGLWNGVWLIANDLILGHAVSVFILQNHVLIANKLHTVLSTVFFDQLLGLLDWLGNWPAGLKLNTELSSFFGDAYSSLIDFWREEMLERIRSHLEGIVMGIGLSGRFLGFTMVLCLLADLISLITLHVTAFHTLSRKTLRFFVVVLSSLFDLFRGKKRNALRGNRLDDATYELDQLLLGTILFTLTAFLFPTIYVYYLAFAATRLAVVAWKATIIDTMLGLLNHIPLFALMLRVKDPARLPAGVWLQSRPCPDSHVDDIQSQPMRSYCRTVHYELRSNVLGLQDVFEGYANHVRGITDLPIMLLNVLLGRTIRPTVQ